MICKEFILVGTEDITMLSLIRALSIFSITKIGVRNEYDFESSILKKKADDCLILINTANDTASEVNAWMWNRVRLNEKNIGKQRAGLPVMVLGMGRDFLEKPEGKVFRDFPAHHQYLKKPVIVPKFYTALKILTPIDPSSLSVIKGDAPDYLLSSLEHDLRAISQKFDYSGPVEALKKRFHDVEINYNLYTMYEKNNKKKKVVAEEIEKLRETIVKKRGDI